MPSITFGGKPASTVAVRSPLLPGIDSATEAKRDRRRIQGATRQDGYVQAAAWRGAQCAYLAERIRRLQPIQEDLAAWLDFNDWKCHPLWQKRNKRYWIVATTILAHERVMRGYIDKVDDLVRNKPLKQQESITVAFFHARQAAPPTKAALLAMGAGA